MALSVFNNIKIKGIVCAVPTKVVKVTEYNELFTEGTVKKFMEVVGVKEYRLRNENQTSSDLCFIAAKKIIDDCNIQSESIDLVIFISETPDYLTPPTACVLHKRLNLSQNCMAFDINLGCSGYIYGMYTACSFMQNQSINRVLVLVGATREYISDNDQSVAMMMGDAGSATLLEKAENDYSKMEFLMKTKGDEYDVLIVPAGGARKRNGKGEMKIWEDGCIRADTHSFMDGQAVFRFTISEVPAAINEFLAYFKHSIDDYDFCILHQANLFILKNIIRRIKMPIAKMPISLDRFGNTVGCSIPLTIVDMAKKTKINKATNFLSSGFGVGLSWGVMSMILHGDCVFELIETNDYFKEAYIK
jgi:3-oxoacyl-[acyl-carrier-protein] synthase-3